MERVGTLINKLKEQFDRGETPDQMALTVQLLIAELQPRQVTPQKSKVSVVMPAGAGSIFRLEPEKLDIPVDIVPDVAETPAPLFDITHDIPTLAHQDYVPQPVSASFMEFNTVLSKPVESLNEKLKDERQEVAAALQGAPIRDLKKGIGVNDRFLFVQDLFRGDENMYERSLKTINGFAIYPEAEYWIQRELKVKLSWPDNSETVRLFDQLVKRRFS